MPFHSDDPLDAQFSGDGKHWTLLRPLHWDDPDKGWLIEVPEGFATDFASVPRPLWPMMPPTGQYAPAAVLHDWLYVAGWVDIPYPNSEIVERVTITRAYADSVLRRASGDLGVSRWTRTWMYLGVRAGGWLAWNRYRQEGGE